MPGPAVYVAVTVGTIAAVFVFKEFIFDPHVRPMFSAWRDSRRRRRARPHSHGVSSSSPFPSEGDDGPQSSPQRGNQGKKNPFKRSVGTSDAPHIDLQELIASESLKAGIEPDGDNTDNLRRRQRRVGESQKLRDRPVGNSADILASSSTQPLISFDNLNISDEVSTARPENGPSSERVVASPPRPFSVGTPTQTPVQAIQQSDASSSGGTPHPLDVRESIDSQTPVLVEIPHVPETRPVIELGNILTPIPMASIEPESARSPFPETGLFSPSETLPSDPYLTPHDQTLSPHTIHDALSPTLSLNSSIDFLSSPSFSPPGSPFIDAALYRELMESRMDAIVQHGEISSGGVRSPSPGAAEGTQRDPTGFPAVRGDLEVFSLPSQVSSDMSSDEGDYDSPSLLGSEVSNWMSDVADAEGAAAQR